MIPSSCAVFQQTNALARNFDSMMVSYLWWWWFVVIFYIAVNHWIDSQNNTPASWNQVNRTCRVCTFLIVFFDCYMTKKLKCHAQRWPTTISHPKHVYSKAYFSSNQRYMYMYSARRSFDFISIVLVHTSVTLYSLYYVCGYIFYGYLCQKHFWGTVTIYTLRNNYSL